MKAFSFLTNLFVLLFLATFSGFSQYEIAISMKTRIDTVILAHIFAKEQNVYGDTIVVMKNGKGVFKSARSLPKGLYSIYNDRRKMFDFLIGDNQKFGIEVDTTDILNSLRFSDSPDNDAFYTFIRFDIQRAQESQKLNEQFKNADGDAEKKAIAEQMQALGRERSAMLHRLIGENEGLYVSKFLKALVPLEIPPPPRDDQGRITDSSFVYRWYRAHFFDNFDIYDPDMLRTPLYEKQVIDYLNWFMRNHPMDSTCAEFDRMLTKARANPEVFRCVLAVIYNHVGNSELMIRENFWVHLVDNWYVPYAHWVNVEDMKKNADKVRPTLIGKIAPPLEQLLWLPPDHFKAAALDTAIKNDIHAGTIIPDFRTNIRSKYLAIIIWDVTCGHCKETIQELWKIFEACKDKGLQVIALQVLRTKEGKAKWIDFINEHGMYDWINAWIIYDNKWHELYDASGVPKVFLLNANKEIVLRGNFNIELIKSFIEANEE